MVLSVLRFKAPRDWSTATTTVCMAPAVKRSEVAAELVRSTAKTCSQNGRKHGYTTSLLRRVLIRAKNMENVFWEKLGTPVP